MKRETVLVGKRFRVDRLELPNRDGSTTTRELVVHPGAVVVLPLLDAETVLLIRNTRAALGRTLLELPAGTREPGEDVALTAARELEEETGHRAAELAPLTEFFASPGLTDERMHVFVATGLVPTAQRLDPSERIEVEPTPLSVALEHCRTGRIEDGKTLAALLFYATFVHRPGVR